MWGECRDGQDILQSLWVGKRLSVMEQLSIRSFLDQGYASTSTRTRTVENVPQGTTVHRGEEILPADEIFCYRRGYGKGSYSAFSNCFRYKLLLERRRLVDGSRLRLRAAAGLR